MALHSEQGIAVVDSRATGLADAALTSSSESPGLIELAGATNEGDTLTAFDVEAIRADLDRARLEIELGHISEATPTLKKILVTLPRNQSDPDVASLRGSTLASLGTAKWESGHIQAAQHLFDEAVEILGSQQTLDARSDGDFGIALTYLNRHEEAATALRRAVLSGDRSSATRLNLGVALASLELFDEAEDVLRAAGNEFPHDRRIPVALALLLEARESPEAVQAYRTAVYLAVEAGRTPDAMTLAQKVLELAPDDWMSHALAGEVLRQTGDYDKALTSLGRARELAPEDDPRLLGSLASTLNESRRPEEALAALDRALELMPDYAFGLSLRGRILRTLGRTQEAIDSFARFVAIEPNDAGVCSELALAELELGDVGAAEETIQRGLAIDPDASLLHVLSADIQRREGRLDEAIEILTLIVQREPANAVAQVELGEVLRLAGRFTEALPHLDAALQTTADSPYAHGTRGQVLIGLGRNAEAIEALRRAVQLDPTPAWLWTELGKALRADNQPGEALAAYDKALERGAERAQTMKLQADALRQIGRWPEALELLQQVVAETPHDLTALAACGDSYRMLGRYDEAVASFRAAAAEDPGATSFLGEFADALRRAGHNDEALETIDRALATSGETGWNVGTKGQILNALGRTDEAIATLSRAVEIDPTLAWAHTDLGYILAQRGRYADALASFERAREEGGDEFAVAGKGQAFRLLGRTSEAIEVLRQAIDMNSGVAWFHAELGEALRVAEDPVEGLRELDRALELDPGNAWATASFAAALLARERYDEALDELDKVVKADPSYAFGVGTRGELKTRLANWEGAIADLTRSLELDANSAWFWGLLGWAYENDEQPNAALEAYSNGIELDKSSLFWQRGRAEALHALRKPEAAAGFEAIIEKWRSNEDSQTSELSVVGWSYYRLGKYDRAVRSYTDDVSLNSDRESTQFDLALALAASGREPLAVSEYERAIEMAGMKHPKRRRALLVVARRDVGNAVRLLDEKEDAGDTLTSEEQAARSALLAGQRTIEAALEKEVPAEAEALAST